MRLATLVERLDDDLRTDDYADVDASANGLQVGPDDAEVTRAAFAVDAAAATIEAAADRDADLLVTHHGLVWGGLERITGRAYRRIAALVDADVALYVSHLPLDGHQSLGNAAGVADALGLEAREPFGRLGPEYIGQRGRVPEPTALSELAETLGAELDTGDGADNGHNGDGDGDGDDGVRVLDFGPERVEDVAVVTGSGVDWLDEAVDAGADLLVTGEGKQQVFHEAREAGVNVVLAGHYATETFGVRALCERVADWGVETTFVDHPTGL